ncbi:MAG: O-antigen ligase family protein [Vicinamibacterales bacterium]
MRAAFVLLFSIIGLGGALASRHLGLLFYVWFTLFRPIEYSYLALYPLRLPLVSGILLLVPSMFTGKFPNITHPLTAMSWLIWVCVIVAQLTTPVIYLGFAARYNYVPTWEYVDQFTRLLLVSTLAVTLLDTKDKMRQYVAIMAASLGFYSAKGGLAAILAGGLQYAEGIDAFPDNNDYALAVNMAIPLMAAAAVTLKAPLPGLKHIRKAFFIAIPLSVITIIATNSRGGLVALTALALVAALLQERRFTWLGGIVLSAVLLYNFAPMPEGYIDRISTINKVEETNETSALGRLHFWHVARIMAANNPLGVGLRYFNLAYDEYDDMNGAHGVARAVHSSHFQVLAELGYLGMALWIGLFGYAVTVCLRIRFAAAKLAGLSDEDRHFYMTMATAFVASMLAFLVGGAFLAAAFNDLTWLTFGGVAALQRLFRADQQSLRPPVIADRAAPVIPRPRRQAIA